MNFDPKKLNAPKVTAFRHAMPPITSLSAVHETGSGIAATVSNYKTKHVFIGVSGLSTGGSVNVQIQQSGAAAQPTWDSIATEANQLSTVNAKILPAVTNVNGDTGVTFTGGMAVFTANLYVNDDGGNFLNTIVTQVSSSTTVSCTTVISAWS